MHDGAALPDFPTTGIEEELADGDRVEHVHEPPSG
jgi:hypothetical protein